MFVVINRVFKKEFDKLHPGLNWMITFIFVNVTWIFFRADSLDQAVSIISKLLYFVPTSVSWFISDSFFTTDIEFFISCLPFARFLVTTSLILIILSLLVIIILGFKNTNDRLVLPLGIINSIFCAMILFWSIMSLSGVSTFLYFNF